MTPTLARSSRSPLSGGLARDLHDGGTGLPKRKRTGHQPGQAKQRLVKVTMNFPAEMLERLDALADEQDKVRTKLIWRYVTRGLAQDTGASTEPERQPD